jgi:membrane-associated protein
VTVMILLAAAGAVIGDHVWYAVGRWRGQGILVWCCRVTMRSDDCIERANALLRRFGPFAIVLGRFLAALRIFVTAVAAGSGMPYYQYLLGEVAGALVWSSLYVLIGYGAGGYLKAFAEPQGSALVAGFAVATLVGMIVVAVGYRLLTRGGRKPSPSRIP